MMREKEITESMLRFLRVGGGLLERLKVDRLRKEG